MPHRAWWVRSGSRTCLASSSERGPVPSPFPAASTPHARSPCYGVRHPWYARSPLATLQGCGLCSVGGSPRAPGWGLWSGRRRLKAGGSSLAVTIDAGGRGQPQACVRAHRRVPCPVLALPALHAGRNVCTLCIRCQAMCEGWGPVLGSLSWGRRAHHSPQGLSLVAVLRHLTPLCVPRALPGDSVSSATPPPGAGRPLSPTCSPE